MTYAQNIQDATLDRSYEYDQAGRLAISHSGAEARAHAYSGQVGTQDGPYSQGYDYDVWGNVTHKYGWGREVQGGSPASSTDITYSYTGNRRNGFSYDAAGSPGSLPLGAEAWCPPGAFHWGTTCALRPNLSNAASDDVLDICRQPHGLSKPQSSVDG